MKRIILPIIILNFLLFNLPAQPYNNSARPSIQDFKGSITGKITDDKDKPLEYATVSIFKTDSTLVTGGITLADGSFNIEVGPGKYYLQIQFISFTTIFVDGIIVFPKKPKAELGTIQLMPLATSLDQVDIVAEKSEMVINLDKKVFNVGKDLSNTGKNALDILDNIPSVTVDLDGNVSLRGSENLQILIDGKPSGMVSAGNTSMLKNMQGSMVEKVEVITNPSARYQAEGMAGIINFVLKKEQQKGFNGNFEVTIGYPQQYSLGTNLNFRQKKFNYFLNYSARYNERPGGRKSSQSIHRSDTNYYTEVDQDRLNTGFSTRLRGGIDYYFNPKNTLTASFMIGLGKQDNKSTLTYEDYDSLHKLTDISQRIDIETGTEQEMEFSANYVKKFEKKDNTFTAFVQYTENGEVENSTIEENALPVTNEVTDTKIISQRTKNNQNESRFLVQADYIYPFGNQGKFETGYRSEFRHIGNPYSVDKLIGPDNWQPIKEYTNIFDYTENIHAIYAQAGNNYNMFGVQAGLRAELSDIRSFLNETKHEEPKLYFDFFPSVHTSLKLNKENSVQLSYSSRINRPQFRFLNPFYSYSDSRNIFKGNPQLKPEYTNSYEGGYLLTKTKYNFYTGAYFRHANNAIERISSLNDTSGTIEIMPRNLDKRNSYGFEGNISLNLVKWWNLAGDINFYRSKTYDNSYKKPLSSDGYSWNTRISSKLRLPKGIDYQTIFTYRAPSQTVQGERKAFYILNMAISKDILKEKGTLTLNAQDILNSQRFKFITDTPELYSVNEFFRSKRTFTLTFVYRLNEKKKTGKRSRQEGGTGGEGEDMLF